MTKVYFFVFVSMLFFACSPKNLTGVYSSYVEQGILMAGYTYDFHGNGTFEMKYWSDDISSNRLGRGTYTVEKRNLLLAFEKINPVISEHTIRNLPEDGGALSKLKFSIEDQEERDMIGVNIIIRDAGGEMVAHGVTNKSGTCIIHIPRTDIEKSIQISYTGMEEIEIPLPDSSPKAFDIVLVEKTVYIESGEQRVYRYKLRDDFLTLIGERKAITLKRESP